MLEHKMPVCPYCGENMRLDRAHYFKGHFHGRFFCPKCDAKSPWRVVPDECWNWVEKIWIAFPEAAYNAAMQAERVTHGAWIKRPEGWVECSECNFPGVANWKRCPQCEAKMDLHEFLKKRINIRKESGT